MSIRFLHRPFHSPFSHPAGMVRRTQGRITPRGVRTSTPRNGQCLPVGWPRGQRQSSGGAEASSASPRRAMQGYAGLRRAAAWRSGRDHLTVKSGLPAVRVVINTTIGSPGPRSPARTTPSYAMATRLIGFRDGGVETETSRLSRPRHYGVPVVRSRGRDGEGWDGGWKRQSRPSEWSQASKGAAVRVEV